MSTSKLTSKKRRILIIAGIIAAIVLASTAVAAFITIAHKSSAENASIRATDLHAISHKLMASASEAVMETERPGSTYPTSYLMTTDIKTIGTTHDESGQLIVKVDSAAEWLRNVLTESEHSFELFNQDQIGTSQLNTQLDRTEQAAIRLNTATRDLRADYELFTTEQSTRQSDDHMERQRVAIKASTERLQEAEARIKAAEATIAEYNRRNPQADPNVVCMSTSGDISDCAPPAIR